MAIIVVAALSGLSRPAPLSLATCNFLFRVDNQKEAVTKDRMPPLSYRQHETSFCSDVSKWSDKIFAARPELPFGSSEIEGYGRGSLKRQDFRVYERKEGGRGRLVLCGEVKLPGSAQGRSPFDQRLMEDAYDKATRENCQYFFTWNVEHLALFDRSRWDAPSMHERCVWECKLGLELNKPEDITIPAVRIKLEEEFLRHFFADFADHCVARTAGSLAPGF